MPLPALIQLSLHDPDRDFRREILRAAARSGSRAIHIRCSDDMAITELHADGTTRPLGRTMDAVAAIAAAVGSDALVLTGFGSVRTAPGIAVTRHFPKDRRIYDVIDDLSYGATGLDYLKYLRRDRGWRKLCGHVVVLERGMMRRYGSATHLDNASHLAPATAAGVRRAVYVGSFDDRLDFAMLDAIARHMPVDVYGRPHPKWPRAAARLGDLARRTPAVTLMGAYDNDDLATLLPNYSHGLVPYRTPHRLTAHINPDKIYHYLNAGLAVISSAIPQARRMAQFVGLHEPGDDLSDLADRATAKRRGWDAAANGWDVRWEQLRRAFA